MSQVGKRCQHIDIHTPRPLTHHHDPARLSNYTAVFVDHGGFALPSSSSVCFCARNGAGSVNGHRSRRRWPAGCLDGAPGESLTDRTQTFFCTLSMHETFAYFTAPPATWSLPAFHAAFPALPLAALISRWAQCLDRIIADTTLSPEAKEAAEKLRSSVKTDRRLLPGASRRRGKRARSVLDEDEEGGEAKGGAASCSGGAGSTNSVNSHNITAHNLNITLTAAAPAVSEPPPSKKKQKKKKTETPAYASFAATYHAMTARTTLQEALFEAVQPSETNTLLLGWLVDLGNPTVCRVVGDEIKETLAAGLVEPARDAAFEGAAERFFKLADEREARTIADYRRVESAFLCTLTYSDEDSGDVRFGEVYFKSSICALLSLLEYLPRAEQLMEGWFDSNVWSWVVDRCFWGLEGVTLTRKEIRVLASPTPRTHCDGILLSSIAGTPIEFGCLEVSHGAKRTGDESKVTAVMKCMLTRLVELVGGDAGVVVVGVVCKGWTVRVGRMWAVRGVYAVRWGRPRALPVGVEGIREVVEVLRGVVAVKSVVGECHRVVSEYFENAAGEGDL